YISINGNSLKKYFLISCSNPHTDFNSNFIIEGIGSASGLVWHNPNFTSLSAGFTYSWLVNFEYDSVKFTIDNNDSIISGISYPFIDCTVHSKAYKGKEDSVVLFPNPTTNSIKIEVADERAVSLIRVLNTQGKILKTYKGFEPNVSLADLPEGLYFLEIQIEHGA